MPLFGAAFAAPNKGHQIKAQQFYTDLGLYQQRKVLQKIVEFKDLSRLLSDFPVLFKADLILKDFSRKPSKFKYFSSMCKPCSIIIWERSGSSGSSAKLETILRYYKG